MMSICFCFLFFIATPSSYSKKKNLFFPFLSSAENVLYCGSGWFVVGAVIAINACIVCVRVCVRALYVKKASRRWSNVISLAIWLWHKWEAGPLFSAKKRIYLTFADIDLCNGCIMQNDFWYPFVSPSGIFDQTKNTQQIVCCLVCGLLCVVSCKCYQHKSCRGWFGFHNYDWRNIWCFSHK